MARKNTYLKAKDQVEVIAGKDKGSVGKILRVVSGGEKVVVEKINMVKRHMRPDMKNQAGGIVEREAPIHASNVMLICQKCAKAVRVGRKVLEDGSKVRVCRKCEEAIEPKA